MSSSLLILFFFSFYSLARSSCPSGFILRDDGSCISPAFLDKADRVAAYDKCGSYNAYPYSNINNAFANEFIRVTASNETLDGYLWLGLVCTSNEITSCIWDDGTKMTKTSWQKFDNGSPLVYLGKCVVMKIANGYWYSARCSDSVYFGCTYRPLAAPPTALSCSFLIDWLYLGQATSKNVQQDYSKQQTYVSNVASMLYANPAVNFEGNFGFYGYSDQCSISNFDYFPNYAQFSSFLTTHSPSTNCQLTLCDAFNAINKYQTPVGTKSPCLVLLSGENSFTFLSCPNSLNKSKFQFIFGVSLNGEIGVNTITNNTSTILSNFDANDVIDTVNMMLSVIRS